MAEALPDFPDSDFSDEEQSPLDISFDRASSHVRTLTSKLDNNQLLELYGLYKQGTEGECTTPKPGWLDGRGRKKWESWKKFGGMPCEEAKEKYIKLVEMLDPEFSRPSATPAGPKETWVAVSSMLHTPEPELQHDKLSLLEAARENCADRVTELLTENPELCNEKDVDGLTALHWAADRNAIEALTAALNAGCPVNATDESGQTALHYAASCGHLESTDILLKAGAKLLVDEEDCTPIDYAADDEIKHILEGARALQLL